MDTQSSPLSTFPRTLSTGIRPHRITMRDEFVGPSELLGELGNRVEHAKVQL